MKNTRSLYYQKWIRFYWLHSWLWWLASSPRWTSRNSNLWLLEKITCKGILLKLFPMWTSNATWDIGMRSLPFQVGLSMAVRKPSKTNEPQCWRSLLNSMRTSDTFSLSMGKYKMMVTTSMRSTIVILFPFLPHFFKSFCFLFFFVLFFFEFLFHRLLNFPFILVCVCVWRLWRVFTLIDSHLYYLEGVV